MRQYAFWRAGLEMRMVFSSRAQMLSFLAGTLSLLLGLSVLARMVYDLTGWNSMLLLLTVVFVSLVVGFGALARGQLSDMARESSLRSMLSSLERKSKRLERRRQVDIEDARQNQVYFVLDEMNNAVKIGVSRDPQKRLSGLQSATHIKLTLLLMMPGGYRLEEELHQRFANDRISGEWFRFSDSIKKYLSIESSTAR